MALHLVTGGSGFVGHALVQKLLKSGHSVRILDPIASTLHHPSLQTYQDSILNQDILQQSLTDVDVVHHAAAAVPLIQSAQAFAEVNIQGTKLVVEAAAKAKVRHFNMLSSSAVYGDIKSEDCPLAEQSLTRPFENYGKSTLEAEQFVLDKISQQSSMSCTILRPRTILGPGRLGIFDLLFTWIQNGNTIFLIGDGSNRLQLIHVDDLAESCLLAAEKKRSGIFNIGTQNFSSLRDSILNLCVHAHSRSRIQPIPIGLAIPSLFLLHKMHLSPFGAWHYRTFHRDYYFDTTKAEQQLGWHAQYSNNLMLVEAYDWFTKNRHSLPQTGSIHKRSLQRGILSLFMRTK